MIIIYDKAQWHIDAGENEETIISKFKAVFEFLNNKDLLSEEGKEILNVGIDSSISLNERMVSEIGKSFLDNCYDNVINNRADNIINSLEKEYADFNK